jgi:GT2 family glycosyltransferase
MSLTNLNLMKKLLSTIWKPRHNNGKLANVALTTESPKRANAPDVAVIVVSWNVRDYLVDCLQSVNADLYRAGLRGKIWVVDNGSNDGTPEVIRSLFPNVVLIANDNNPGFGAANNQGMRAAMVHDPRYLFFLNPDTLVRPGAFGALVSYLDAHPEAGMVGPRLIYGSGRFQHSAFAFPGIRQLMFEFLPLPARLYETPLNGRYPRRSYRTAAFSIDHPLGAAMMVRRDVAEATHGFDESFFMYCEEIDWCWRIREAGWEIYTIPSAEIIHYGGESTKQIHSESIVNLWESRARFYRKHHDNVRLRLAQRIVYAGLTRKAAQETLPDLKDAYERAAQAWIQS